MASDKHGRNLEQEGAEDENSTDESSSTGESNLDDWLEEVDANPSQLDVNMPVNMEFAGLREDVQIGLENSVGRYRELFARSFVSMQPSMGPYGDQAPLMLAGDQQIERHSVLAPGGNAVLGPGGDTVLQHDPVPYRNEQIVQDPWIYGAHTPRQWLHDQRIMGQQQDEEGGRDFFIEHDMDIE